MRHVNKVNYYYDYDLFFDNFFSSPILQDNLLDQQTYACTTVHCTHKDPPPCAKNKLCQPGETIVQQPSTRLFTRWHDKCDVAFLSTDVSPKEPAWIVQKREKHGCIDQTVQFHSLYTVGSSHESGITTSLGSFLMLLLYEHQRKNHQRTRNNEPLFR